MTFTVIGSNIICQEVGYFKKSAISLSLRMEAFYSLCKLYEFQAYKMTVTTVIHFVHDVALYFSDTIADFQKDSVISNMPTGQYFVLKYFSVTCHTPCLERHSFTTQFIQSFQ